MVFLQPLGLFKTVETLLHPHSWHPAETSPQGSIINPRKIACWSAHRLLISKAIIFVLNVRYRISNQNRLNNREVYSFPRSSLQTSIGTNPSHNRFLMLPLLFPQTNPLSSRMQEHSLGTYHPLAKLCISVCPCFKNKSIETLSIGRKRAKRNAFY